LQHAFLAVAATRPSRCRVLLKLAACQFNCQSSMLQYSKCKLTLGSTISAKAFNHTAHFFKIVLAWTVSGNFIHVHHMFNQHNELT